MMDIYYCRGDPLRRTGLPRSGPSPMRGYGKIFSFPRTFVDSARGSNIMKEIATDAWVLYRGSTGVTAELKRENFSFPELTEHEILVEPIYGCWEGNMTHALERNPIDICEQRQEE